MLVPERCRNERVVALQSCLERSFIIQATLLLMTNTHSNLAQTFISGRQFCRVWSILISSWWFAPDLLGTETNVRFELVKVDLSWIVIKDSVVNRTDLADRTLQSCLCPFFDLILTISFKLQTRPTLGNLFCKCVELAASKLIDFLSEILRPKILGFR